MFEKIGSRTETILKISRGCVIEIDAALDIAQELKYKTKEELKQLGMCLISTFRQLTG